MSKQTQAVSGAITSAAAHRYPIVDGGSIRTVPPGEGAALSTNPMENSMKQTPMPLPLPDAYQRCLAHGLYKGDWCIRADNCARHVTLRHPEEPNINPMIRACLSDEMVMHLPLEGFADDEEVAS